uniref:Caspase family p20 domain-containing protein n=1 Tax=Globodera rostochiensis TaxID=31243 RepID=A0A914HZJ6_GLORO
MRSPTAAGNFELSTNLAELPYGLFAQLANQLENEELWRLVFSDADQNSAFHLSSDEATRCGRMGNSGAHLLRLLGNRGQTVKGFLARLHCLAKLYGPKMDVPQLLLRRRFCSVIWARAEQVLISRIDDDGGGSDASAGGRLRLQCKASAFPTPRYQWLEQDRPMDGANQSSLTIIRCQCTARNVFRCRVWNVVEDGHEWSDFYRAPGKTFCSELISEVIDLQQFVPDGPNKHCAHCNKNEMEGFCRLMLAPKKTATAAVAQIDVEAPAQNRRANDDDDDEAMTTQTEALVAADKLALIVSNRTYAPNMSNLITPHCDAETLAEALQQLSFKTVTLGDLNLIEMRALIREYRKLLGEGVYAVFYFVGHGFEAHGQCYLLPIGAPGHDYGPEHCLSMDWVMDQFRDVQPAALNLILLDICRKFLPSNLDAFTAYAQTFRQGDVRINRSTVYGYATSGGVGAYEVKGEQNGVFMKYLKRRIHQPIALLDMLNKVFRDVERDPKVCDVQIPELRSNLTNPRSLRDPLVYDGHTTSYDHHTYHWRTMHELPMPVNVDFAEHGLRVTIWFDFCGHFTNKVYVFSSVGDMPSGRIGDDEADNDGHQIADNGPPPTADASSATGHQRSGGQRLSSDGAKVPSRWALSHLAFLKFSEEFDSSKPKFCEDDVEGVSLCVMLSHLQRAKGEVICSVNLSEANAADGGEGKLVAIREGQSLGHVLITRLELHKSDQAE